ncbi:bacterial transcriptional activator domain-containing protein [Mycobacterium sp.]|uniref:bacterial transcriptional activator domain-containing protein n=1 Tax=Mycobacterium sp. TaxID=1785 RepID=UPI0025F02276|nr:bacterial transcriptional activator domain-containing protein [Mycobacterium sp.]
MTATLGSAPVTSLWYGQGRAVDVTRRLESLTALPSPPGPAGVITARPDDVTVTFVEGLRGPLPPPWQAEGREARIGWESVPTGGPPDPEHPVYLVVFGTTDDGALIALNLAAFSRVRIGGDPATAAAVITRWVLELLATHPDITIGLTEDVWSAPWTTRVRPVAPGHVPAVDVLVCGSALTYAERAQIVAAASSPILLDLGDDAAVTATWSITCGADREGQIGRGAAGRPMSATLIVPGPDVVDRCAQLITAAAQPAGTPDAVPLSSDSDDSAATETALPHADQDPGSDSAGIDFFEEPGDDQSVWDTEEPVDDAPHWRTDEPAAAGVVEKVTEQRAVVAEPRDRAPAPVTDSVTDPFESAPHPAAVTEPPRSPQPPPGPAAAVDAPAEPAPAPAVAPIWNRILGRVTLSPPYPGAEPGPRERRLNELLVYLQLHRLASTDGIIAAVFSGAATEKTVTQQMSLLRKRLGILYAAGPKALPPMSEGTYSLERVVCSDWNEFDRLVEILVEATPTSHLIAAMDLVTGPALGGIPGKEWPWARNLREQMRDRVPGAAAVLARRQREAGHFAIAVDTARKGLWYDSVRQDLWEMALSSALECRDNETFRALRSQYLNTIAGPDRDSAVLHLTGRSG